MDPQQSSATPFPTLTLSPEELAAHQRRLDDRDARLLMALTVLSAIAAGFCLVLALQVSQYTFGRNGGPATAPVSPPQCTEGEFPSRCPAGEICQDGSCVPTTTSSRCEPGALCGNCSCEQPLLCDERNVCVLPRTQGVCENGDVLKFLSVLKEKCGDARKCESKDLDKYAIAYEDFLSLMVNFPNTLAIHFPEGQPSPLAERRWPSDAESEHYINRIRMTLDELKSADRVILVGLASKGRRIKDRDTNRAITLQRLLTTQDLIRRAAVSVLPPAEADQIEAKVSFIHLGDRRPIDARFYGDRYGNRPIAWDTGTEEHLRGLVEQGGAASLEDVRWRDRLLNQVVFVVPIPCKQGT